MNEPEKSAWILETSDESFERDVIERSREVPVVVDFWASWCQPCRLLGPMLEALAEEYHGGFVLVKADTERNPVAASHFRVQSIPAVYGLRDGKVVDGFLGAMPAAEVRQWLERFLPSLAETLLAAARRLQSTSPHEALERLRAAVAADPRYAPAQIAMAEVLFELQQFDESQAIIDELARRGFLEPEAERIRAALEVHAQGALAGSVEQCRARVAQNSEDSQLKLQLASALAAAQGYEEALEICLAVVQQGGQGREPARQTMVDIFRLLPDDSDLVATYRRRLAMALY